MKSIFLKTFTVLALLIGVTIMAYADVTINGLEYSLDKKKMTATLTKAYLPVSSVTNANGAKALRFVLDDGNGEITGIGVNADNADNADNATAPIYNLQGQRVSTMKPGAIYIIGGKKVVGM